MNEDESEGCPNEKISPLRVCAKYTPYGEQQLLQRSGVTPTLCFGGTPKGEPPCMNKDIFFAVPPKSGLTQTNVIYNVVYPDISRDMLSINVIFTTITLRSL